MRSKYYQVTFTSVPIDALIRRHFLVDDGSVLIRNVTTSSDDYQTSHSHICYALFEKEESNTASTISNTDDVEPVPERGIVLGTGGAIFGVNGTTTTATDDAEVDARQEDTGEVDSKYWDIDVLDQHLSSSSSSSSAHRSNDEQVGQYNICRIRFEFKCSIINDNDDEDDDSSSRKQLDFGYVFASQEYMDDNRGYDAMTSYAHGNDAFTVLLNGQNIAMIPVVLNNDNNGVVSSISNGISVPVSVDSINTKTNSEYFINYKLDGQIVSANGFTVELHPYYNYDHNDDSYAAAAAATATTLLLDEWNVIEFTISDVGDDNINSWAFLSANSFSCRKVMEDVTEGGQTVDDDDDDDDQERNTTSSVRIPLLMALTIAGLLGILGLALPILCLNFYNKRLPSDERFFGWLMKGW